MAYIYICIHIYIYREREREALRTLFLLTQESSACNPEL